MKDDMSRNEDIRPLPDTERWVTEGSSSQSTNSRPAAFQASPLVWYHLRPITNDALGSQTTLPQTNS